MRAFHITSPDGTGLPNIPCHSSHNANALLMEIYPDKCCVNFTSRSSVSALQAVAAAHNTASRMTSGGENPHKWVREFLRCDSVNV